MGHRKQLMNQVRSCITKAAGFNCGFCGKPYRFKNDLIAHQRNACRSTARPGTQNPCPKPVSGVIRYAKGGGATMQPRHRPNYSVRHYTSNGQIPSQVRRSSSLPNMSNVPRHTSEQTARRSSQPSELEGEDDIEILWSTLGNRTITAQ